MASPYPDNGSPVPSIPFPSIHNPNPYTQPYPYNAAGAYYRQSQPYYPNPPPIPYPSYAPIPMGGAGPGPATMQNGYGGYGEYGVYYGYTGYPDYQGPQAGYQSGEGDDYSDPSKTPGSTHAVPQPPMNMVGPNHNPHLGMPQQFPSYPPNHPYAFGGGVGYPQGYNRPPQHMHQHQHHPQPQHPQSHFHPQHQQHLQQQGPYGGYGYQEGYHGVKLNPAAQGFKYNRYQQQQQQQLQQAQAHAQAQAQAHAQTQAQAQLAQAPPRQPVHTQPPQPPQPPPAPAPAPIAPSHNQTSEPLQPIPNGHSHLEPSIPSTRTEEKESQSTKEQNPASAPVAVKEEEKETVDDEASFHDASSAIAAPRWNFVHPSSLSSSSAGIATSSLKMNNHAHSQRIRLVKSRPAEESDGNSYAMEVKAGLPQEIVVDEQLPSRSQTQTQSQRKGEGRGEGSRKGRKEKKGTSKRVWKTGEKRRVELVFGEVVPEQGKEEEEKAELVVEKPVVDGTKEEKVEKKEVSTPTRAPVQTQTQAPAPAASPAPAKPRSWAALLKTPTHSSPSTPDAVPSSSASVSSTTEAGPSRPRPSTSTSPSTPNLTPTVNGLAQPQPSPQAQGGQPQQQAKTFNYAAAAMSSVPSPHEDLVKLLSEGVSSIRGPVGLTAKEKEALMVPRGLINTGNMCFANTVR